MVENFFGGISFPNKSFVRRDVARIALAMVRGSWGRTSVEKAPGKSDGRGIISCGAGIRLTGGMPEIKIPPINPAPMTQSEERSGIERYFTSTDEQHDDRDTNAKEQRVFDDKTSRRPEQEQGEPQLDAPHHTLRHPSFDDCEEAAVPEDEEDHAEH